MKKLFVFVFVAFISTSVFSTNEKPVKKEEVRTKIVQLLGNPNFVVNQDVKTSIDFLINKSGEIVILNIDCDLIEVCNYVKSRLNYKTVNKNSLKINTVYTIPLVIKNK